MDQLMYARELQEKSGAFLTVTPLNVEASGEAAGTAFDYLRAVAITRIMLDNVTHVRSSYETQGLKVAQMALKYGADDFGLITLSKGSEGGMHFAIPIPELERNIREAGFTPVCRSARYEPRPTPQLPVPAAPISLQLPK
jgi:cyclic dehypoxanthinyl futalosine synthase